MSDKCVTTSCCLHTPHFRNDSSGNHDDEPFKPEPSHHTTNTVHGLPPALLNRRKILGTCTYSRHHDHLFVSRSRRMSERPGGEILPHFRKGSSGNHDGASRNLYRRQFILVHYCFRLEKQPLVGRAHAVSPRILGLFDHRPIWTLALTLWHHLY